MARRYIKPLIPPYKLGRPSVRNTKARKKRRPNRLLNRQRVSKRQQAIYDHNADESLLLNLPPEIRTRIFELVLSASNVHVWHLAEPFVRHCVCSNLRPNQALAAELKADDHDKSQQTHEQQHRNSRCFTDRSSNSEYSSRVPQEHRFDLRLLGVCRQIHREAALLPFEASTFTFDDTAAVERFIANLVPEQAQSIRSITSVRNWTSQRLRHRAPIEWKIEGLKHLVCIIQFHDHPWDREFARCQLVRGTVATNLIHSGQYASLSFAAVVVFNTSLRMGLSAEWILGRETLQEWVEDVERELLVPREEVKRRERMRELEYETSKRELRSVRREFRHSRGLRPIAR